MWIVYVIKHNISSRTYIGFTSNLKERLLNHNRGDTKSTKRLEGEWMLVYAEVYKNKYDAQEREKKLKHHGSSKHELFKRIRRSLV